MKKNVIFFFVVIFIIVGCSHDVIDKKAESNKIIKTFNKETADDRSAAKELKIVDSDKYYQVKGTTLVKYLGEYDEEIKILLPKTVKKIASKAFSLSKKQKESIHKLKTVHVEIPLNIKVEKGAFGNAGPMNITFEEGRKNIDSYMFYNIGKAGCESVITLPQSTRKLGKYCFWSEGALKVILNDGLEELEESSLAMAKVDRIPATVKIIGNNALGNNGQNCNKIPEGVKYMGTDCMIVYDKKVSIPSSVEKIELGAVLWKDRERSTIRGYEVAEDNSYYKSDKNGWLYSKDGTILYYAYRLEGEDDFVVPKGVKKVYKNQIDLLDDYENKKVKIIAEKDVELLDDQKEITDAFLL